MLTPEEIVQKTIDRILHSDLRFDFDARQALAAYLADAIRAAVADARREERAQCMVIAQGVYDEWDSPELRTSPGARDARIAAIRILNDIRELS